MSQLEIAIQKLQDAMIYEELSPERAAATKDFQYALVSMLDAKQALQIHKMSKELDAWIHLPGVLVNAKPFLNGFASGWRDRKTHCDMSCVVYDKANGGAVTDRYRIQMPVDNMRGNWLARAVGIGTITPDDQEESDVMWEDEY